MSRIHVDTALSKFCTSKLQIGVRCYVVSIVYLTKVTNWVLAKLLVDEEEPDQMLNVLKITKPHRLATDAVDDQGRVTHLASPKLGHFPLPEASLIRLGITRSSIVPQGCTLCTKSRPPWDFRRGIPLGKQMGVRNVRLDHHCCL